MIGIVRDGIAYRDAPDADMPAVGQLTVPHVQHVMRENLKFRVALEKVVSILGDRHPFTIEVRALLGQ